MKEYITPSMKWALTDAWTPGMAQTVTPNMRPPPQGMKMVLLIHSMYRSKPILYERVYHTEYEMGPN